MTELSDVGLQATPTDQNNFNAINTSQRSALSTECFKNDVSRNNVKNITILPQRALQVHNNLRGGL